MALLSESQSIVTAYKVLRKMTTMGCNAHYFKGSSSLTYHLHCQNAANTGARSKRAFAPANREASGHCLLLSGL
jgi:hypothetical protein